MMLSDLDGFLYGIACSPVLIRAEEWMPVAFGGSLKTVPKWVLESVAMRFKSIADGLTRISPQVDPIFWQHRDGHVIAMDWCEGFMTAVQLRPKDWLRLTESGVGGELITPIMVHMLDDQGHSILGVSHDELDQTLAEAAEEIPRCVVGIHQFW
jgi:uncharacterized protein